MRSREKARSAILGIGAAKDAGAQSYFRHCPVSFVTVVSLTFSTYCQRSKVLSESSGDTFEGDTDPERTIGNVCGLFTLMGGKHRSGVGPKGASGAPGAAAPPKPQVGESRARPSGQWRCIFLLLQLAWTASRDRQQRC